jgi:hypothetical protein
MEFGRIAECELRIAERKVEDSNHCVRQWRFKRSERPPHPILLPSGDCVAMERVRGEAVGFQRFRTRVF